MILMVPVVVVFVVALLMVVVGKAGQRGPYDVSELTVFGTILLVYATIALAAVPMSMVDSRSQTRVKMAEYSAMFDTIRDTMSSNAGMVKDLAVHETFVVSVSNANEWIRGRQALNAGVWDAWVADEIDDIEEFKW